MSENTEKPTSSAAAAFDLDKLRDELKCCICLNMFEEPKSLPCGHIYCAACVQGLIDIADQPVQFITCPECRVEVRVPADGQFPTAFAIKSLVSHFKHAEAEHSNEIKLEVMAKEHGEKIAQLEKGLKQLESQNGTLAKLMGEQAEKMEGMQGQFEKLTKEKNDFEKHVRKQDEKLEKLEEKQAKDHDRMEELASENGTMMKLVEKTEKLEMKVKLFEEKEQAAEYARLIGMPNVAYLKGNYDSEKLLNLVKHGNGIGPTLYIQWNQQLDDGGLFQCVVDLLVNAEKPEEMLGELVVEYKCGCVCKWPQNEELKLKLKENKSNVAITFNEATGSAMTWDDCFLAEYELANKDSRFQVLLYHFFEGEFNKLASKFVYRRLDWFVATE